MKPRHLTAPALAAIALAVGCGGSDSDRDVDPAALVPANAPVYAEAKIDRDGDDADAVRELVRKLTGTADPDAELKRLAEKQLAGEGLSWEQDIAPWVGDRVGLFLTAVGDGDATQGAIVAAAADPEQAKQRLEARLSRNDAGAPVAKRTYHDVAYTVVPGENQAVAIVDDFAVAGTESAVKAAIDASKGDALDELDAFDEARDQHDDPVAFAYLRLQPLLDAAGPQAEEVRRFVRGWGEAMTFAVDAEKDAIRFEAARVGIPGDAPKAEPGSLLGSLPKESWLALGAGDVGRQFDETIEQALELSKKGVGGSGDVAASLEEFQQETGMDLRRDVLRWMGDVALFVRGTSLSDLGGALVIETSDRNASARFISAIRRQQRAGDEDVTITELKADGVDTGITLRSDDSPVPVHIALAGDRFILAVTDGGLQGAIKPDGTLDSSDAYKNAVEKLDDDTKPTVFFDITPVRTLLDMAGTLGGNEALKRVTAALGHLTTIVAGSETDGGTQRYELVVGVK
jgi:hypothetical protein